MTKKIFRTKRLIFCTIFAIVLFGIFFSFCSCGQMNVDDKHTIDYLSLTSDFKTEYYVGESFKSVGDVQIMYKDGHFDAVPLSEVDLFGFTTERQGDVIITISYGGVNMTQLVRVLALTATEIVIDQDSFPSVIYKGQDFPTNVAFTATMIDGSSREVFITPSMLNGYDSSKIGTQLLTLTYAGKVFDFPISVCEDEITSIELVCDENAVTNYSVNQKLSVTGINAILHYDSGKKEAHAVSEDMISDFNTSLGGSFEATVTYAGKTCRYPYKVTKVATDIALVDATFPTVFEHGETFPTGAKANVSFDDGTSAQIDVTEAMLSARFSTVNFGNDFITNVKYENVSAEYKYSVLKGITNWSCNGYTRAVMQDSAFDGFGELTLTFEDGSHEVFALNDDRLEINYTTKSCGDIAQRVKYRRENFSFNVNVFPESEKFSIKSISVDGVIPAVKCNETIDISGLTLCVNYKYLDDSSISLCDAVANHAELSQTSWDSVEGDCANKEIVVSYLGAETTISVNVLSQEYAEKITNFDVFNLPTVIAVGESLDLSKTTALIIYGGGYQVKTNVPVTQSMVFGFDNTVVGEQDIKVKDLTDTVRYVSKILVIGEAEKIAVTSISVSDFDPLLFEGDTIDSIDFEGASLVLTYGYGYDTNTLPLTAEMFDAHTFSTGEKTLICKYGGLTFDCKIQVHSQADKNAVTGIKVKNDPISCYVGEDPNYANYTLMVEYGYGYRVKEIAMNTDGVEVGTADNSSVGLVLVQVKYAGFTANVHISFESGTGENVVVRIENSAESKTVFEVGDDFSGVKIIVYYALTNEIKDVTEAETSGFDSATAGDKTLIIEYGGKTAIFNYKVM